MAAELKNDFDIQDFPCFAIDLKVPGELDIKEVDRLIGQVVNHQTVGLRQGKYVVLNDCMYIFDSRISHSTAFEQFRKAGLGEEPQSAGRLDLFCIPRFAERIIGGSSHTIPILDRIESDRYQQTVIRETLGNHFSILDINKQNP